MKFVCLHNIVIKKSKIYTAEYNNCMIYDQQVKINQFKQNMQFNKNSKNATSNELRISQQQKLVNKKLQLYLLINYLLRQLYRPISDKRFVNFITLDNHYECIKLQKQKQYLSDQVRYLVNKIVRLTYYYFAKISKYPRYNLLLYLNIKIFKLLQQQLLNNNSYLIKKLSKQQPPLQKMLQSFSINNIPNKQIKLNCYRCHKKPKQFFVILLCDHIICAACLDQFNQLDNKLYDGIKCTCGVTTYKRITNLYTDDEQDRDNTIQMDRQHYYNQQVSQHQDNKQYQKYQKQKQRKNISVNIHTVNLHKNKKYSNKNNNNTNSRDKTKQNSKCPSIGLVHSKNTTSTKNISRINTQPYGFINTSYDNLNNYNAYHNNQNQTIEYEADRQQHLIDKFMLQKSKYSVTNTLPTKNKYKQDKQQDRNYTRQFNQNNNKQYFNTVTPVHTNRKIQSSDNRTKTNIVHHIPKFIYSQSIISQSNDKQNNNPNTNYKYLQKKYNRIHTQKFNPNNSLHSLQFPQPQQNQLYKLKPQQYVPHKFSKQKQQKNNLTSQLNSQIKYLKLTHKKNLQTLQRTYLKTKQKINEEYQKLQSNLKDICLQAIVLDRKDTHVNFNKIIQMRYQTCVGKNLCKLTQDIKKYGVVYRNGNVENDGFLYEETNSNQFSRCRLRKQRFTSPQPFRNTFIQAQPQNIYKKCPKYHHSTNYQNLIAQTYSRHNNIPTCTHTPNPSIPTSSKLHKKTAKRRTNIVIQL